MNQEKEIGTKEEVDDSGTVSGSRRKLLASIGLAGTALVAGSLWSAANVQGKRVTEAVYGAEEEGGCWPKVTIAELRSLSAAPAEFYVVTDPGQEGVFRFDPADVSSADDTGMVIVSATGARFKRIFQGAFNVKWFGAKGDNASDDTLSIQAAVNAAQNRGSVVYFPSSDFYLISSPILIDSSKRGIRLIGDDYNRRVHSSVIRPHAFRHGVGSARSNLQVYGYRGGESVRIFESRHFRRQQDEVRDIFQKNRAFAVPPDFHQRNDLGRACYRLWLVQ